MWSIRWCVRLLSVVLLINFASCQSDGIYSVVGSRILRPNSEYHVSVNVHDSDAGKQQFRVGIEGTGGYSKTETVDVEPHITKNVELKIGSLPLGQSYKLVAQGVSGTVNFKNETELNVNRKTASIFVQTDKAMYKPGDIVRFRILILDSNTRPANITGPVDIEITDPHKNIIKQIKNAKFERSVLSDELALASETVLGVWTINIAALGEKADKTFEVAEYVLPKFEVSVTGPKHFTYKEGKIGVNINAKYTYGKPVKGEATVSIFPRFYGFIQPAVGMEFITRKVVKIDGKAPVEFDIDNELKLKEDYEREMRIEVIVEEDLTGRKQNASSEVTLHKSKYKIEKVGGPNSFKPGLPIEILVRVVHHDGSPVQDSVNPLKVSYGFNWDDKNRTAQEVSLDSNGMAKVKFNFDNETSHVIVDAEYLDVKEGLGYYNLDTSESGGYIQAKILTSKPTINKEIEVQVESTDEMDHFTYQILGRGDIILTKTVQVSNTKLAHFKFLATFAMVPNADLVVYYIKGNEIVSDYQMIEFNEDLHNTIDIELSSDELKPGQDVTLTVSSSANSYVGLLGVDQSVLLLKSGNDLSKDKVFSELNEYKNAYYTPIDYIDGGMPVPFARRKRRVFYGYQFQDFSRAGAALITNAAAKVPSFLIQPFYRGGVSHMFEMEARGAVSFASANAMPGGMLGAAPPMAQPPRVRKEFPETWLWNEIASSRFNGRAELRQKVPDTITSWVITGFSLNPATGLGLTKNPRTLKVFQPFFVSINLPYSVKRGEVVSIPIVVFNYMSKNLPCEVTLENPSQEFEFAEISNEAGENENTEPSRMKRLNVNSNDGKAVSFMIRPKKIGSITIKVTATSPVAGDSVERLLLVEPEGVTQYKNVANFVDLSDKSEFEKMVEINVPKTAVPDSTKVTVSVVGDLLGRTIKNIESLIRMPYGCGEQNMLNFVPNIVILDYLKASNQLTDEVKMKAKKYMEAGYQRELTYKHSDGSFSAFGQSDASGSTWLTAFVARSFNQAKKYIDVEMKIINEALKWLSEKQASNGSFPEVGHVSHKDMQGGAGDGIALTAFTLITFLENEELVPKYRNTINRALDYIVRNTEGLNDIYSLALAAYALHLAKHTTKDYALQTFDAKATTDGDIKYWHKPIDESETKNPWFGQPNSVNVEMTAYGLLAYIEAGHATESLPIVKWLISQQNDMGGFLSTQDTVVGLMALAKFAQRLPAGGSNIDVVFKYNDSAETKLTVNPGNSLVLQSYEMPSSVRAINVTATGRGLAIVQVSYKYNMNVTGAYPKFVLDPQVNKISTPDYLHLTVCTSFVPVGNVNESNMAVMEVSFPSGFTADLDTLPSVVSSNSIKRYETKNADTVAILYFDSITLKELCPTVNAYRTHKVAKQKPAAVKIYDYYDNSRQARTFYKLPETTLCDICEGDDCGDSCTIRAEEQRALFVNRTASNFDGDRIPDNFVMSIASPTAKYNILQGGLILCLTLLVTNIIRGN